MGSEAARDATCRRGPTNDAEVGIVIPTAKKITLALDLDDEELPVEGRVSRDDRRLASVVQMGSECGFEEGGSYSRS